MHVPSFGKWAKYSADRKLEIEIIILEMFGDREIFRGFCRDTKVVEIFESYPAFSDKTKSVLRRIQMDVESFLKSVSHVSKKFPTVK